METVSHDGIVFAMIMSGSPCDYGVHFMTKDDASLQLACIRHPAGHDIVPHEHNVVARSVQETQEVLVMRSGVLRVDFYDAARRCVAQRTLRAGDVILLLSGGHGFHVLEEAEFVEVKTGPYLGGRDKTRFEPVGPLVAGE